MSDRLAYETICPLCLERYPPQAIPADYPMCPECCSEAMDFEVEALDTYMAGKTVADFDDMLTRWYDFAGEFRPQYHAAKAGRIAALRALKAAGG